MPSPPLFTGVPLLKHNYITKPVSLKREFNSLKTCIFWCRGSTHLTLDCRPQVCSRTHCHQSPPLHKWCWPRWWCRRCSWVWSCCPSSSTHSWQGRTSPRSSLHVCHQSLQPQRAFLCEEREPRSLLSTSWLWVPTRTKPKGTPGVVTDLGLVKVCTYRSNVLWVSRPLQLMGIWFRARAKSKYKQVQL